MSCALTQSIDLGCKESAGGIRKIYVTELANKNTISPTGDITVFTLDAGKQFWTYDLRDESSSFTQNVNANNINGTLFYEQVVTFSLDNLSTAKTTELFNLAKNDVMVIIQDENDNYWLAGEIKGCYTTAGTVQTGQAKGDLAGYTMTLTGKEKNPARAVSSTLIATLTAPA
jgi:hypothetical protein